jgi:glycosyltransferase involved in cell wall biosynthesis
MHVLQLGPYPPPEGGINRNILAIRSDLRSRGDRCSIIATSHSTTVTDEPDVYHPRSPLRLVKLLFTVPYDVLHLHVGGRITARMLGLVFVCSLFARGRNVLSFHSGGYPQTKAGRNAKWLSFRGFVFRRFAKVIAVNTTIADTFRRYGVRGDKIRVILPFVPRMPDPSVVIPVPMRGFIKQSKPFLLTVGLLEDEYDLFMQIEAMESILAKFPNAGLMIVGSGALEYKLKQGIADKPFRDRVFLAGDVKHAVTLHLIKNSDVLLRTTRYDGDAISIREALFLETPVIATDNGLRPNGVHLIAIGDKQGLIEGVKQIGGRKKKQETATTEDADNIAKVLEVYDDLVSDEIRQLTPSPDASSLA